jgi:hypothetical protein
MGGQNGGFLLICCRCGVDTWLLLKVFLVGAHSHVQYLFQPTMATSDHSELYSTLAELWTLLDDLAALPPGMVALPPTDTGIHPPSEFNADSAWTGGFTEEAVTVLASLPYLIYPLEIQSSTSPRCFLHAGLDGRDFEETREMIEDDPITGSAIVLTESSAGTGCYYVYDTEKSKHFNAFC